MLDLTRETRGATKHTHTHKWDSVAHIESYFTVEKIIRIYERDITGTCLWLVCVKIVDKLKNNDIKYQSSVHWSVNILDIDGLSVSALYTGWEKRWNKLAVEKFNDRFSFIPYLALVSFTVSGDTSSFHKREGKEKFPVDLSSGYDILRKLDEG